MSRCRKHTPYIGICVATTAKPYKRLADRRSRSMERAAVRRDRDPYISTKVTPDPRLMAYDGKRYRVGEKGKVMRK